ncbi:conjugal transfer protein TraG [Pseudomaricurvus alkylphenolicus]|uniref:conjugal transfer protein TraG N-terminal domain-containing protein n=1 Tax=Pseudomaricurvus alkylphenolicus TaxID=1306991 RepID=UPI001423E681|nr:conjugal transfer protein TraG N-terminal domain-containing protein [Pseudomaricurvus alkylphenolicus]NIB44058.1 conjugal transfer protein TraG [Pseudomaricurvus alkylphenolicus]
MAVDSYLELFTTLFGWVFYGMLWDVLVNTGLVYLPFLGILIDNWKEPAQGGEVGHATSLSLRRMEIDLFMALMVVVLAGQPSALTPLNASALSYAPPPTLAEPTPPTATVGTPQSTYGVTGFTGVAATVNVPVWWYGVLAVSSGVNHAVVAGLPTTADMRTYEQQAHLATIADPRLRKEVSEFFTQCYIPARSQFQRERPDTLAVNTLLTTFGQSDPDWLGSHVYRDIAGYYDRLRPIHAVVGWPYSAARDTEYDPASPPLWGKPYCKQWWEDSTRGLRQQLINEADATSAGFSSLVVSIAPGLASEEQRDAVAKTVLKNAPPVWSSNELVRNNASGAGLVNAVGSVAKTGLAAGGIVTASALFSVTMTAVIQALPMVQAVLLLGIYALLPLVVVLSRYSLSMMVVGAMAIFTVKFWSVLWYLAMWVDQNLILSMYPDVKIFLETFASPGEHDAKRMLLNMITTSLYLGLPLLWSGMMAWAGIRVGHALESATIPIRKPALDAGNQGGSLGKAVVGRGLKR